MRQFIRQETRRNPDEEIRALERAAASGDQRAKMALRALQRRTGQRKISWKGAKRLAAGVRGQCRTCGRLKGSPMTVWLSQLGEAITEDGESVPFGTPGSEGSVLVLGCSTCADDDQYVGGSTWEEGDWHPKDTGAYTMLPGTVDQVARELRADGYRVRFGETPMRNPRRRNPTLLGVELIPAVVGGVIGGLAYNTIGRAIGRRTGLVRRNPRGVTKAQLNEAEREYARCMMTYGENNLATDSALIRYMDLKEQWAGVKARKRSSPVRKIPAGSVHELVGRTVQFNMSASRSDPKPKTGVVTGVTGSPHGPYVEVATSTGGKALILWPPAPWQGFRVIGNNPPRQGRLTIYGKCSCRETAFDFTGRKTPEGHRIFACRNCKAERVSRQRGFKKKGFKKNPKDKWVFVEWKENGKYHGGNYKESVLPKLLQTLKQRGVTEVSIDDQERKLNPRRPNQGEPPVYFIDDEDHGRCDVEIVKIEGPHVGADGERWPVVRFLSGTLAGHKASVPSSAIKSKGSFESPRARPRRSPNPLGTKRPKWVPCQVCGLIVPSRGAAVLWVDHRGEQFACIDKGGPRANQKCASTQRARDLIRYASWDKPKSNPKTPHKRVDIKAKIFQILEREVRNDPEWPKLVGADLHRELTRAGFPLTVQKQAITQMVKSGEIFRENHGRMQIYGIPDRQGNPPIETPRGTPSSASLGSLYGLLMEARLLQQGRLRSPKLALALGVIQPWEMKRWPKHVLAHQIIESVLRSAQSQGDFSRLVSKAIEWRMALPRWVRSPGRVARPAAALKGVRKEFIRQENSGPSMDSGNLSRAQFIIKLAASKTKSRKLKLWLMRDDHPTYGSGFWKRTTESYLKSTAERAKQMSMSVQEVDEQIANRLVFDGQGRVTSYPFKSNPQTIHYGPVSAGRYYGSLCRAKVGDLVYISDPKSVTCPKCLGKLSRRSNPFGTVPLILVGNAPSSRGRPRRASPPLRRRNDEGGPSFEMRLPANRVKGSISMAEGRKRWGSRIELGVAGFKDFHKTDPSDDLILYDDGKKEVTIGWVGGVSKEVTYGGDKHDVPDGSVKDDAIYVHRTDEKEKGRPTYLVGLVPSRGGDPRNPVTRDFMLIGSMRAQRGWLRD